MDSGDETSEYATVRTPVGCRYVRLPTSPDYARNVPIMLESVPIMLDISKALLCPTLYRCHRKFCRPEILSRRQFFSLGDSIALYLTQRPHFLGNSVALLHRDTLPRSTAEFDIGGGTRGYWVPVPPLMSREEAASFIK